MQYPLTLQCANISILEPLLCHWAYPGHITKSMLCAGLWEGGRGSCQVRSALRMEGISILWGFLGPGREGSRAPDFLDQSKEGAGTPGSGGKRGLESQNARSGGEAEVMSFYS